MTDEWQITFCLRAQAELLLASLSNVPAEASKQRKAITLRLAQIFVNIAQRMSLPLVLEIGAHEGTFSKTIKNLHPESRVIAFEAHPLVYATHASAMKQVGVEYVQSCVAHREGEMILKVPKKDGQEKLGQGSVLGKGKGARCAEYPVKSVTLDAFLAQAADLPSAMWIDVEGGLAPVLAGAERTLRNCQAVYVEMESVVHWEGQMIDTDVVSLLAGHGLKPVLRDVQKNLSQYNAIFLRIGEGSEVGGIPENTSEKRKAIAPGRIPLIGDAAPSFERSLTGQFNQAFKAAHRAQHSGNGRLAARRERRQRTF